MVSVQALVAAGCGESRAVTIVAFNGSRLYGPRRQEQTGLNEKERRSLAELGDHLNQHDPKLARELSTG